LAKLELSKLEDDILQATNTELNDFVFASAMAKRARKQTQE
jgi:hypothetical protein